MGMITVVDGLVFLGIAFCIIGVSAIRKVLRNGLRLPGEKYVLLAAAFSIGIPVLIQRVNICSYARN
jgi:hypothetical protein